MYNSTKLLQVRGSAGMQPHSKRKSCSTRTVCDLTGDSTHGESVSMHNEENYWRQGNVLECNITFLCSRHIRPTCTKRSRCVCILRHGNGNCSNTKQNQQYINYVLKYDVSILLLSVPPVTREWKDACMAKSPGQAQRENATTPHADNVSVTI